MFRRGVNSSCLWCRTMCPMAIKRQARLPGEFGPGYVDVEKWQCYRGGLPHQGCSGQAKSTPKRTHNFAIKACQESQRSLQRPTPPPPPARMRRTSCVAGLPECLCLQQPPRRHALLRHRHLVGHMCKSERGHDIPSLSCLRCQRGLARLGPPQQRLHQVCLTF